MPTLDECVSNAGRVLAEEIQKLNDRSAGVALSPGGVSLSRE